MQRLMLDSMTCKQRGSFEEPDYVSIFRVSLTVPLLAMFIGLWIGFRSASVNALAEAGPAKHEINESSQADDQIAKLIEKLNSPLFADREAAWRELHGRGREVREALVQRLKSADRELALRIREIVGLIDLEIPNNLPSDVIELFLTNDTQRAQVAKSGVLAEGSPLELLAANAAEFEIEALTTRWQASEAAGMERRFEELSANFKCRNFGVSS